MPVRIGRALRALALATAALALAACTGLPTTGDVKSGLALGASPDDPDILLVAPGPLDDADPTAIVEGFLRAAITPADSWAIARQFLTPELAASWRPSAGVSIDESAETRSYTSSLKDDDAESRNGDTAEIQVRIDQVASVDETGAFSETVGTSPLSFVVVKTGGDWRISKAPNGVVVDEPLFSRVFGSYSLQYFDKSWSRLVPDVRWLPRRENIATAITQSLISGVPSPWLEPAVQSAFPSDIGLARDAVPIDRDQVADVALNRAARGLDPTTLARMRTQLQATLEAAGIHVAQVRFTIDGRDLEAGVVKIIEEPTDAGSIVLKDGAFGALVGSEITPIPGVSDEVLGVAQTLSAVDVAVDGVHAAVQLADGHVYLAGEGGLDPLDERPSLITPSLDPYGYTWSVPSNTPAQLFAWGTDSASHQIAEAWPDAAEVSGIRVSADGARVAAVVTVGGEHWIVVSAVVRDDSGLPTALGDTKQLAQLTGTAKDLVWLGSDRLGLLAEEDGPKVLTQIVGGTGSSETAPAGAVSAAGARSVAGMRVLDATGSLFTRSGSAWRESTTGVLLLATRAGH